MSSLIVRSQPLIVSRQPTAPEAIVAELNFGQKLALMQMSDRNPTQAVYHALRDKKIIPPFTLSTFVTLRRLALAELKRGQRYHTLTMQGREVADAVATAMQRDNDLHWPRIGGDDGVSRTVHCTCGWSAAVRRGEHVQMNAMRAHSQHLRTQRAVKQLATSMHPPSETKTA